MRIESFPDSTFQSTGPLRDPTKQTRLARNPVGISIHRSLAGPDFVCGLGYLLRSLFQSTGPLRDPTRPRCPASPATPEFQSTGPLRDPTSSRPAPCNAIRYFNPQVPCGTRRYSFEVECTYDEISIHRSLAGPDRADHKGVRHHGSISIHRSLAGPDDCGLHVNNLFHEFQSTGPLRDPTSSWFSQ